LIIDAHVRIEILLPKKSRTAEIQFPDKIADDRWSDTHRKR